jgi:hypothetical protein
MKQDRRRIFLVRFRAGVGVDPVRNLRALLKIALRRLGLRAIEAKEEMQEPVNIGIAFKELRDNVARRAARFAAKPEQPETTHE